MLKIIAIASIAGLIGSPNAITINIAKIKETQVSNVLFENEDQFVTLRDEGKFVYHYDSITGTEYQATFWRWNLSSIGITNNE